LDYDGFATVVNERMHYYSTNTNIEKIKAAQDQVEETKRVMMDNLDLAINRGEKLENIVAKTDNFRDDAFAYRRQATSVKRQMCFRNNRTCCAILIMICVVLLAGLGVGIYFFFKYAPWNHNKHHSSSSSAAPLPPYSSSL